MGDFLRRCGSTLATAAWANLNSADSIQPLPDLRSPSVLKPYHRAHSISYLIRRGGATHPRKIVRLRPDWHVASAAWNRIELFRRFSRKPPETGLAGR